MKKEFKKGEIVYLHAIDTRDRDETAIVANIGKKWITCKELSDDGTPYKYSTLRFNVETLRQDDYHDYYQYELYHSKKDYEEEIKRREMINELETNLRYTNYSLEELLLFKEIHERGVEKWKQENLKQK